MPSEVAIPICARTLCSRQVSHNIRGSISAEPKRVFGQRCLHRMAQTILVLSLLHGSYFLFIHFTQSFHKAPLASLDWFRVPFLTAGLIVIGLQAVAFSSTSRRNEPA